jgi:phage terminase large subunit
VIQQTTALRKIAGLRRKIKAIRGGQGSGKTISILILLINHAASKEAREILIVSAELTKMRLTVIKDFVKVMRMFGIYDENKFIAGTLYRFPNGSFIKFLGLDKTDVGKGLRSHVAYFNEVNKIEPEAYRQIASRTGQVYLDYNPDATFFVDQDILPREDCSLLQLTFEDNELLPEAEREEILNYYTLGYYPDGTIKNPYWANLWQVYGLGNIGSVQGVVCPNWEEIDEVPPDAELLYGGIDFGFSISKFAALNVYRFNGAYIFDELLYDTQLTNPQAAAALKSGGYKNQIMYCDSAEPKSIQELRDNGIRAIKCESKNDIKDFAIRRLNEKVFYITKRSVNLKNEERHLVWDEKTGKVAKSHLDHLMDAKFYAVGSGEKYKGNYMIGNT